MVLSDISIKRPVFATVLSLVLVIFGLFAFERLAIREYPDIDPPTVSVVTLYKGASAQIIESQVTQILEEAVAGIEGITLPLRERLALASSPRVARSNSSGRD